MERAKLDENPAYDPSFLREVMSEQQQLREVIEADKARLETLSQPGE